MLIKKSIQSINESGFGLWFYGTRAHLPHHSFLLPVFSWHQPWILSGKLLHGIDGAERLPTQFPTRSAPCTRAKPQCQHRWIVKHSSREVRFTQPWTQHTGILSPVLGVPPPLFLVYFFFKLIFFKLSY